MNTADPVVLIVSLVLIGFGLAYPMVALYRINRLIGEQTPDRSQIILLVALTALWPLTAVLAGFWLMAPMFRASPLFTGALIAAAILLAAALIVRWRLSRGGNP